MSKKRDTKVCAAPGCQREATHICYLARDKGLITHQYVCEDHFKELPCSYVELYEKGEADVTART